MRSGEGKGSDLSPRAVNQYLKVTSTPELDVQSGRKLTGLQKIAEKSHGVMTPANLVTLAGVGLTALGCYEFASGDQLQAVGIVALGAVCDAVDGLVARKTRTDNYTIGRRLDAVADGTKAAMLAVSLNLSGVYSGAAIAANYGPKVLGWMANSASIAMGGEAKTSPLGKVAEVCRWAPPTMAAGQALLLGHNMASYATTVGSVGQIATVAACGIGLTAAAGYTKDLLSNLKNKQSVAQK